VYLALGGLSGRGQHTVRIERVADSWQPHLSVGWQDGTPEQGDQSLERAGAYTGVLARMLAAAGYEPRQLEVRLRRGLPGYCSCTCGETSLGYLRPTSKVWRG
jgi:hypothetical protein